MQNKNEYEKKKKKKNPVVNAYEWANLIPRLIRLNYM